jgi:hypothetical protein
MQPLSRALSVFLLVSSLPAQAFVETFTYADGAVPGWTAWRGTWSIANQRLRYSGGTNWGYITLDNVQAKDSVLDGLFYSDPVGAVNFAGLTSRHPATNVDNNLLMCKIQSNQAPPTFDRSFLYERAAGGSSLYVDVLPHTATARCRFITLDARTWMQIDGDLDGVFEQTLGPLPLTSVLGPGGIGMSGYQSVEMDDFKYYDAVLVGQSGVPQIGTTYTMQFRAPQPAGTVFLCLASRSNTGIPIDGARTIPLTFDGILQLSLAAPGLFNFSGVLDNNGDGFPSINLPNDPSLIGAQLFVAGVTLSFVNPSPVVNISNDHRIVIQ